MVGKTDQSRLPLHERRVSTCAAHARRSTSRTGHCCDTAAMERFLRSTKHEKFDTPVAARLSWFQCVETFCHTERLPQVLCVQSPTGCEADHAPAQAA